MVDGDGMLQWRPTTVPSFAPPMRVIPFETSDCKPMPSDPRRRPNVTDNCGLGAGAPHGGVDLTQIDRRRWSDHTLRCMMGGEGDVLRHPHVDVLINTSWRRPGGGHIVGDVTAGGSGLSMPDVSHHGDNCDGRGGVSEPIACPHGRCEDRPMETRQSDVTLSYVANANVTCSDDEMSASDDRDASSYDVTVVDSLPSQLAARGPMVESVSVLLRRDPRDETAERNGETVEGYVVNRLQSLTTVGENTSKCFN